VKVIVKYIKGNIQHFTYILLISVVYCDHLNITKNLRDNTGSTPLTYSLHLIGGCVKRT